ncbi:tetratricopeptide repeat protein [Aliarcobacter lanthieri]|uniref:tetratricopeptide repeat protein n=1 Tax=Aliarcobacter lanthieri TaxID=1355374 RepID=UPI003AA907C8
MKNIILSSFLILTLTSCSNKDVNKKEEPKINAQSQLATIMIKRAQEGDMKSQNNLGTMYAKGFGIEQDFEKAVFWWEKAANQGDVIAQNNLGFIYYNGENNIEQDYQKSKHWLKKACENGSEISCDKYKYILKKDKNKN